MNVVPVNGAYIITDFTDSDNLYAQLKDYTATASVTDANTYPDITTVDLTVKTGAGATIGTIRYTEDTDTFSIFTGTQLFELGTGSAAVRAGNTIDVTYKFRVKWGTGSEGCTLELTTTDASGAYDTDSTTNYLDVITRLITYDFAVNATNCVPSYPLHFSGKIHYANTATGDSPSASYPSDPEFTGMAIVDDEYITTVTGTVSSGAFAVNGTAKASGRVTQYRIYIDMADADYADDYAPDGDTVTVTTTGAWGLTWPPLQQILDDIFSHFTGLVGIVTAIQSVITAFSAWFLQSVAAIISLIYWVMMAVIYASSSVIFWLGQFVPAVINVFTIIGAMIDGSGAIVTGLGDLWGYFGFSQWLTIIPIFGIWYWVAGLAWRVKRSGRGTIDVIVGDLQVVAWIVGEVWGWVYLVFNAVVNLVFTLISYFKP